MPTRRTTVLIADDHTIVKEGLVSLLKAHDFDVVGAVGDGEALIDPRGGCGPTSSSPTSRCRG